LGHIRAARPIRAAHAAAAACALVVLLAGCGAPKRIYREPGARPAAARTGVPATDLEPRPVAATVRVALARSRPWVAVTCDGPWSLHLDGGAVPVFTLGAGDTLEVGANGESLSWLCDLDGGTARRVAARPAGLAHLIWNDASWRGDLVVTPSAAGTGLDLIDHVPLESYVQGVVAREMGRRDESERAALAAQAVATRTFTVARMRASATRPFDVVATTSDQVYGGSAPEHPLASQATRATAGWILTGADGPIDAYYHAACGGRTARVEAVWPHEPRPYLTGVDDTAGGRPWCRDAPGFAWSQTWTGEEIAEALQRTLPAYVDRHREGVAARWAGEAFTPAGRGADPGRPGTIVDLAVRERTASGRVAWLDVTTTAGTYHVRGDRVRSVLDPPGDGALLRSSVLELDVERRDGRVTRVEATGRGHGHGLGLCQHGALARSRSGQDLRAILAHYYPGARLEPLSAEVLP